MVSSGGFPGMGFRLTRNPKLEQRLRAGGNAEVATEEPPIELDPNQVSCYIRSPVRFTVARWHSRSPGGADRSGGAWHKSKSKLRMKKMWPKDFSSTRRFRNATAAGAGAAKEGPPYSKPLDQMPSTSQSRSRSSVSKSRSQSRSHVSGEGSSIDAYFVSSHVYATPSASEHLAGSAGSRHSRRSRQSERDSQSTVVVEGEDRKRWRHGRGTSRRISFEEWLEAKKKVSAQRAQQRRREAERLAEANAARRRMSARSYDEWLASKLAAKRRSTNANSTAEASFVASVEQSSHVLAAPPPPDEPEVANSKTGSAVAVAIANEPELRALEVQHSVAEWEHRKTADIFRRRELRRRLEAERTNRAEERRRLSQAAWQLWKAQVANRQRPLGSLTNPNLSRLYMSPQRWHSLGGGGVGVAGSEQAETSQPARRVRRAAVPPPRQRYAQRLEQQFQWLPLSAAQRSLQRRLNDIDGLPLHRRPKWNK